MFTGIVEQTGFVRRIVHGKDIYRLEVLPKEKINHVKKGDSLSVNGACLTLIENKDKLLVFDIMNETFRNTAFQYLRQKDTVNIERSLEFKSRIDGHFVLGHVDSVKRIKTIKRKRHPFIEIFIRENERKYVARKGSVAIDGISLTISGVYENSIRADLIPYTLENTNLRYKKTGDAVNVEFDILAKYIHGETFYAKNKAASITARFLKNKGFI